MSVREHGPGELAAVCGTVFQDPETQVVMGGVRAELALPLEHRGERAGGGGARRWRRWRWRWAWRTCSTGAPTRSPAASCSGWRSPPRWCTARALLLLDEPTSQLDPVAGDELIWLLRRLNEEWGTAVVLAEHRLERCLPAADRVIAIDGGARGLRRRAARRSSTGPRRAGGALATPVARLFSLAGLGPLPASVKEARERAAAPPGWRRPRPREPPPAARRRRRGAAGALRRARRVARDRGRARRCCAAWT